MIFWKKVHNQHPFGIREISRVGLGEFSHSPILPDYLRNTLLGAGEGQTNSAIARNLKVSINTAQRWRNRFAKAQTISYEDLSLEDRLQDGPRPGAPSRITADQRCQIEALACEKPEKSGRPISQWTAREIADEVLERKIVEHISSRHAARLLKRR